MILIRVDARARPGEHASPGDTTPTGEEGGREDGDDEEGTVMLLAGRRALVTGAANGIGRAIAERFAAEGATVAAADLEEVPDLGSSVLALRWDLSRTERLGGLVQEAEGLVGPLDVLVNNAGIFEPAPALELTLESYRRVLAVNLDAPVFLAAAAARGMIERGYGRIVNISSIHGRFGEEQALAYDVAKGGLDQATRTLAIELGRHGVLVNAIAPGFVQTRMSVVEGVDELQSEWFSEVYLRYGKLPLRRYAQPAEVAEHAAWLASERNTYVTGHVLTVDGGLTVTF
ncbi:MAG TPA: SDR family NAD(P)-dependent oxidoreductase [Gaiellaceae bacterium]|nr:SDR family NAD(P)-dependent oxidoreductase [Gaiellaceae bacterium]